VGSHRRKWPLRKHPWLTFLVILLWGIGAVIGLVGGLLAACANLPAPSGDVGNYDALTVLPVYFAGVVLAAGAGGWIGAWVGNVTAASILRRAAHSVRARH
jgi:hypothetical protein